MDEAHMRRITVCDEGDALQEGQSVSRHKEMIQRGLNRRTAAAVKGVSGSW